MLSRSGRGFSLIEVIVTVAVLSTAIMFVLRSFAAALAASKIGQDMTLACLLAENEFWKVEQEQRKTGSPLDGKGSDRSGVFSWNYATEKNPSRDFLMNGVCTVSWKERRGSASRQLQFYTQFSSP